MRPRRFFFVALASTIGVACACQRDAERATIDRAPAGSASAVPLGAVSGSASVEGRALPPDPPPVVDLGPREVGPYEIGFKGGKRKVFYAVSSSRKTPQRVIANLHGVCNPPGYACGYWVPSASSRGFMVCPRGNSECAPGVSTWTEPAAKIDEDLEDAIAAVDAQHPGEITRDGGFLTGFSLGAATAPYIAKKHPGRWPYLILVEATVALDAASLKKAGVKAVALVAGELGANVYGQRAIAKALNAQGMPAKTWVMPKAGHWYSANIDQIMAEAMDWCLAQDGAR